MNVVPWKTDTKPMVVVPAALGLFGAFVLSPAVQAAGGVGQCVDQGYSEKNCVLDYEYFKLQRIRILLDGNC